MITMFMIPGFSPVIKEVSEKYYVNNIKCIRLMIIEGVFTC